MIKKETLEFLEELRNNNNRDWFHNNKGKYQEAKNNILEFVTDIFVELAKEDTRYLEAKPSKALFRIFRDMRFAKEGSVPYKDHFGIVLSPNGTKSQDPAVYMQIAPEGAFIATGLWRPGQEKLVAIRQEIDYTEDEFHNIVKNLETTGWKLESNDTLKKAPRGYDETNKNIRYIKLKSFVVTKPILQKEILNPKFKQTILKEMNQTESLTGFLQRALI